MTIKPRPHVAELFRERYTAEEVRRVREFLRAQGTFRFPTTEHGLFPAAVAHTSEQDYTGYAHVWVRDTIHIAHAHWMIGQTEVAVRAVRALARFLHTQLAKIEAIVQGECDASDAMLRPHIRFDGHRLTEVPEKWAHAQNDALGYFLWLYARLLAADVLTAEHLADDARLIAALIRYLRAIRYWQDEDSGHWEETRKIEASSIGAVVAALRAWHEVHGRIESHRGQYDLNELIAPGVSALHATLPAECVQPDPTKARRYDAALLFLIYPLEVVNGELAEQIVTDVKQHLMGPYGIRRYLGDSYWCADYKTALAPEQRTADFSDDLTSRDRLLRPGMEAQWCIFDPILSIIHGRRYQRSGDPAELAQQTHHFHRALNQLTSPADRFPAYRCPESYYCEAGQWVPNDVTPLLWTQANLLLALHTLERSAM
jgi:phosphorylase kinase alpha/beta subunit